MPFNNKLESILAPLETNNESLNSSPEPTVNFPPILSPPFTYKLESIVVFPIIKSESLVFTYFKNLSTSAVEFNPIVTQSELSVYFLAEAVFFNLYKLSFSCT